MKGVNVFSTNIPKIKLGSGGIEYFGDGKFNVIIPLTDGTNITAYNPEKDFGCGSSYNVPICSFSKIKSEGCYVMSNNANNSLLNKKRYKLDSSEKAFVVTGKRGRLDPNAATMALVIQEFKLYADFLKTGNSIHHPETSNKKYKNMEVSEIFEDVFKNPKEHEYAWDAALTLLGKYREERGYVSKLVWQSISKNNFKVNKKSARTFRKMFSV